MKVNCLMRGWHILPLMIFLICAAGPSLAQESDSSDAETVALDQTALIPENSSIMDNESSNVSQSVPISSQSILDLSYIWSVSGIEIDNVIMALNQENEILYGQAKYEPDGQGAWNAVVIGSVKEDNVDLVMTYLDDGSETSTRLNGTYDPSNQSIRGDLLKVKDGEISERGTFEAIWINPDTASYTPAVMPQKAEPSIVQSEPSSSVAAMNETVAVKSGTRSEDYYHDVRQDAVSILTGVGDLSQIPIGMGGSGLS